MCSNVVTPNISITRETFTNPLFFLELQVQGNMQNKIFLVVAWRLETELNRYEPKNSNVVFIHLSRFDVNEVGLWGKLISHFNNLGLGGLFYISLRVAKTTTLAKKIEPNLKCVVLWLRLRMAVPEIKVGWLGWFSWSRKIFWGKVGTIFKF